ncbi:hypothetical protein PQU92_17595 [Asticcacaulis sp. BYS171W]|uniref:Lipoprotein n=1 Tax=Asticcacaulis aquaticus TaxID=2984212 RepID=A0ABT5HYV3_9CAUL|nr:hypothetical protein [Asticcacaulis aquaticus]MDC7685102.1 hypothetical protein [Asticcacaulis aquaticus]
MKRNTLTIALIAGLGLMGTHAFAGECDDAQQGEAGTLAAGIAKAAVSKVVPVTGKQMVNLSSCENRAGTYIIEFKYNFLSTDGLYWVEGNARFGAGGSSPSVKITKASPNMAAAEAKAGVKLASN